MYWPIDTSALSYIPPKLTCVNPKSREGKFTPFLQWEKNAKTHRKGCVGTGRDERLGQKYATYHISFVFRSYVYYFVSSFGPEQCGWHSAN